jgi:hypothetical protein
MRWLPIIAAFVLGMYVFDMFDIIADGTRLIVITILIVVVLRWV